ncbi:MAG: hypothetical protein QNJ40_26690, partial [Xanthomonadales bacterium]|nr:hypothetical protein [Xanthomonadales bacterium]
MLENSFRIAALAFLLGTAHAGQIIDPPTVRYIGPEESCDYPDIQSAVDDLFCRFCAVRNYQFRLSPNYVQAEKLVINRSFSIVGGFDQCQGPSNGLQHVLNNPSGPGALFTFQGNENRPIEVNLTALALVGNNAVATLGGVVNIDSHATVRLDNVRVTGGDAVDGGGIGMAGGNNRLEISNSTINNNRAVEQGGGIWCQGGGEIDFTSGLISGNTAETVGGGIGIEDCHLTGSGLNRVREISSNSVLRSAGDDALGKGGGVYARGNSALVELGGLLSDTVFRQNVVAKWEEFFANNLARTNGGGLHLQQGARAILRNTRFIENEAPNGGAVSLENDASFEMDRTAGPCLRSRASECSSMVGNIASGQQFGDDVDVGAGSAILAVESGIEITLRRTELRDNLAQDHDGQGLGKSAFFGSMIQTEGADHVTLSQNLIFSNLIEGDNASEYFRVGGDSLEMFHNTIVFNERADGIIRIGARVTAVGNIWMNPELDEIHDTGAFETFQCNLQDRNVTSVTGSDNSFGDPMFADVSSGNFRLLPGSAAINRCDNAVTGLPDVDFDIEGRLRPSPDGTDPVLGTYDSGALEFHSGEPDEVDLAISLNPISESEFELTISNLGLTA